MPSRLPRYGLALFVLVPDASGRTVAPHPAVDAAGHVLHACLTAALDRHPSIPLRRSSPVPTLLSFCAAEEESYRAVCESAGHERLDCLMNAHAFAGDVLSQRRRNPPR